MKQLTKPPRLRAGDTVATVSLSSGLAGEAALRGRYEQGKRRLQEVFGLRVVEMPFTLAGIDAVYAHPEKRAADMMAAFADPAIRAVLCCTGGDESIRLTPYIDYDIIAANPKLFSGYSDSTIGHLHCFKAGVSSLYGPSLLSDFAENVAMSDYTVEWINKLWFSAEAPGPVPTSPTFTAQWLEWVEENRNTARTFAANGGYQRVQGEGVAQGPLFGGCLEILNQVRGTSLFPPAEELAGAILFLETSEEQAPPWMVQDFLRGLAAAEVLPNLAGILWAKPMGGVFQAEYHEATRRALAECGRRDMPVLGNASFGHNEPKFPLPYGVNAQIDIEAKSFSLLEGAVC